MESPESLSMLHKNELWGIRALTVQAALSTQTSEFHKSDSLMRNNVHDASKDPAREKVMNNGYYTSYLKHISHQRLLYKDVI